jgi:flagellin-like hook-associated protein FlgL
VGLRINTNKAALNARESSGVPRGNSTSHSNGWTSGPDINRAGDDAAVLSQANVVPQTALLLLGA